MNTNKGIKVYFAQIDARDDALTGYNVAAFNNERGSVSWDRLNKSNIKLQERMCKEYLTRLYALQQEIAKKYEALYDSSDPLVSGADRDYDTSEEAQSDRAALNKEFGTDEASYYT